MKQRALTLTEVVVVVAIIALVSLLLLPVLFKAKKQGNTVPCTTNLRQVYAAIAIYQSANEDMWPLKLNEAVATTPALAHILACPGDWTTGANEALTTALLRKASYFYLPESEDFRKALEIADPNHGIAYCVMHGERVENADSFSPRRDTTGLVMRLRRDGSVQRAKVGHWCSPWTPNGRAEGRQQWSLLSDVHCVEPHCRGLTEQCD